ncbi:hypothetical protein SLS60_005653 [Paraconiothyrium brasiliense]|uniref:Uncharacterized protein n=1 Tax=Paraconiothyrium brasiliense TaxID=300254 RepID=A0ABR3RI02_9PLEO
MATDSMPRLNGASPGSKNIKSTSDPFPEVQGFLKAMTAFTTKVGFSELNSLISRIASQEAELKVKDSTIGGLTTTFEERSQVWGKKEEILLREVETSRKALVEKEEEIASLQEKLNTSKARISEIEKELGMKKDSLKQKDRVNADLDRRVNHLQQAADSLREKQKESDNDVISLKEKLDREESENKRLQMEAAKAEKTIKEYKRLTVKIAELDLPLVKKQLETLWESVVALIVDFFGRDLPKGVLEDDWTKLNDNEAFRNRIPLPKNNTRIAKQMRVAVVLGAIARLVVEFLFQPTYLLDANSGLQQLLRHQATVDPRKEMYTRGILLSMPHEDQEEIDQEKIESVIDDLMEVVRVDVLLATDDDVRTFQDALEVLLNRFQEQWKCIQRGKQKLEPNPDARPPMTAHPWYMVDLPQPVEDKKRNSSLRATAAAQDDTIIVPQIVLMRERTAPEPLTHGWVLQQAQIHAAHEEILNIRRGLGSIPVVEEIPTRPRVRKRTMSITADPKKGQPFLP